MIVLKFGGSSVASSDKIENIRSIVEQHYNNQSKLIIVVSAMGGITDLLIKVGEQAATQDEAYLDSISAIVNKHEVAINEMFEGENLSAAKQYLKERSENLKSTLRGVFLIREFSNRTKDFVCSFGEIMSSFMVAKYLSKSNSNVELLDSRTLIKTDDNFCQAKVDIEKTYSLISEKTSDKNIYVAGGFVASNDKKETTTLGRGGSDYSAAIYAAASNADELHIWTDVDGVMSADPRKVKKAFSIPKLTYDEAMELSHFGAKVIYPPTIKPVLQKHIPVRIKNTFNPGYEGTLIKEKHDGETGFVKGISSIPKISLIRLQGAGMIGVAGISGRLFSTLAVQKISVILISQASSEHSICFAVKPADAAKAKQVIDEAFKNEIINGDIEPVILEEDKSVLAVVGASMNHTTGIAGRLFQALGKNGVNISAIAQGSSELNISLVIDANEETKALNIIHDAMFLSKQKTLNLFIVGTGLIGGTLLNQIKNQSENLLSQLNLELKIIGITNSRKMIMNEDGIDIDTAIEIINDTNEAANLDAFVDKMISLNLPNSIFVDNTASEIPIEHYLKIISESISIVTPNKIAKTSDYNMYLNYLNAAEKSGAKFLYETNVGAGLPIISTLKDLMQSGDEIVKIEAVLSGSLSFIFNTYTSNEKFSDVVKLAGEKGFTEPDPRIDLSGKDVARKVLILAREIGKKIELSDIEIENILPDECIAAPDVPSFFEALEKHDAHFENLMKKAEEQGKKMRILATIENDKSTVALKSVDSTNPFFNLSGSDNMVVFTTKRYNERPLVIKGPGAGAEVTAAGVFAEIISIGKYLA